MRTQRNLLIAAIAALTLLAPVARAAAPELVALPGAKLWLEGTSTIHEYKSDATKLQITVKGNVARWPADKAGVEAIDALIRAGGVSTVDVVVPVTGLKSGKDGLDKNMYKALKAAQNPDIKFHLAGYQVPGESAARIDAKGMLTIAGVEHDIPISVTATREGENLRLRGTVPLLMSQYGIKPPTMMMGTLKVADAVKVSFDFAIGVGIDGAMTHAQ